MEAINRFLQWFPRSLDAHPNGYFLAILTLLVPGILGVHLRALRRGELHTRFGWVRRNSNPVAFRLNMVAFGTVIFLMTAAWAYFAGAVAGLWRGFLWG
jgi:hypothetical protein